MATSALPPKSSVVKEGLLHYRQKKQILRKPKEYYGLLFKRSHEGLARLELYENQKAVPSGNHVIILVGSDVIKVQRIIGSEKDDSCTFVVNMKDSQHFTFIAKNSVDCGYWVKAIQDTMFQYHLENSTSQFAPPTPRNAVTEDNDLYLPAEEMCREFKVTLGVETRQKLMADGTVRLLVENGHITIISLDGNRIVRWGIEHLRRLGYTDDNFHIEAGRKSERGAGDFLFLTKTGRQIHTLVNKEKEYCRRQPDGKMKQIPLPVGQVSTPASMDFDLPLGNHIYEDITLLQPPPSLCGARANSFPAGPKIPSTMVPSLSGGKSQEQISQPTFNGGQKPIAMIGIKSLPTSVGSGAMNHARHNQTDNSIYSEAVIHSEAWRNFGRNDDEYKAPEENTYDNLSHFNPSINKVHEDPYQMVGSQRPEAEGTHLEASRKQQKPVEDIYAQVNMNTKTKNQRK